MRHALILCLAFLVLSPPVAAQEKDARKEAESTFFKAYYEENGKRDLGAAEKAYTDFLWQYERVADFRDLVARAYLAKGRIHFRTGRDPLPFLEAAEKVIRSIEDRAQLEFLLRQLAFAKAMSGEGDAEDAVAAQIRVLVDSLGENTTSEEALKLFGARAVPELAKTMRSTDPRKVAAAARVTVAVGGEKAVEAVTQALQQKDLLFPVQVAMQLSGAGAEYAPAFRAVLAHPSVEVRRAGVTGLRARLGYYTGLSVSSRSGGLDQGNAALEALMLEALSDGDAGVRRAAIRTYFRGAARVKAVEAAIGDTDPKTRDFAVKLLATLGKSNLSGEMAGPILELFNHEDPAIRREIVKVALVMGGETAQRVIVKALSDPDSRVVHAAADQIVRGTPEMAPVFREGMVRFCGDWAGTGENWVIVRSALDRVFEGLEPEDLRMLLPTLPVWSEWEQSMSFHHAGVFVRRPFDYIAGCIRQLGPEMVPDGFLVDAYGRLTDSQARATWIEYFGDRLNGMPGEQVRAALESPYEKLRTQAVILVPAALGAGAREELTKLLKDPSERVRKAAAGMLASTYKREAVELLKAAMTSDPSLTYSIVSRLRSVLSEEEIRTFVNEVFSRQENDNGKFEVLYGAGDWVSDEHVLVGLASKNNALRGQAANVAGNRQLLEAWPLLLGHRDNYALNALKQIENYYLGMKKYRDVKQMLETGGDAREKAMGMVRSDNATERRAGVYALGALGDPTAISLLLDLVRDPDEKVREAALGALERLGGAPKKEEAVK